MFSLTDVVLMNLAGIRSTAVLMPDPLLSVSSLAAVDALADETIPSMQYGSLNPEHQVLGAYTNRLRNVRFTADLRVRREFVTLRFYRATQLC